MFVINRLILSVIVVSVFLSLFVLGEPTLPENEGDEERIILDMTIDDHRIIVPIYEAGVTSFQLERLEFTRRVMSRMVNLIKYLIHDLVIEKKSYFKLLPYAKKIYDMAMRNKAENDKLVGEGFGRKLKDGFVKHSLSLFKDIFKVKDETKEVGPPKSEEEKKAEARAFVAELNHFLDIFEGVVYQSPVGDYLDWKELSIDGKTLLEIGPHYVNYLRKNGKGISILEAALNLLDKVKW